MITEVGGNITVQLTGGKQRFVKAAVFLRLCSGWWFCQHESKHGWVPASYLEPLDGPEESEEAEPNYEGKMFMLFSPLNACSPPACVVNGVGGPEELEEAEPSYEGKMFT